MYRRWTRDIYNLQINLSFIIYEIEIVAFELETQMKTFQPSI